MSFLYNLLSILFLFSPETIRIPLLPSATPINFLLLIKPPTSMPFFSLQRQFYVLSSFPFPESILIFFYFHRFHSKIFNKFMTRDEILFAMGLNKYLSFSVNLLPLCILIPLTITPIYYLMYFNLLLLSITSYLTILIYYSYLTNSIY